MIHPVSKTRVIENMARALANLLSELDPDSGNIEVWKWNGAEDIVGDAEIALRQYQQVNEQVIPIAEVNFMNLSPEAVQLAHHYIEVVEQQDRGDFSHGFNADELERVRTRRHNAFLDALKKCGVDTRDRADTTALARRIVIWIPD